MNKFIRNTFKPLKVLTFSVLYLIYDGYRFLKYSSVFKRKRYASLDYKIIKAYHSLEKSLSFKNRDRKSGWVAATRLINLLEDKDIKTFQKISAVKVLEEYYKNSNLDGFKKDKIESFLKLDKNKILDVGVTGGVITLNSSFLLKGKLDKPEDFFESRYSIRAFRKENVEKEIVHRALKLASKTPSVCNRQSWGVFHLSDIDIVSKALLLQNGNRGFSSEISDLLIITTDLSSFDTEIERFQAWIDGGIYAMSLVYAFHSLGIGSCFLNLSLTPSQDLRLRKLLNVPSEYSFITMVAIGYPDEEINLCVSPRTPYSEYYFNIK